MTDPKPALPEVTAPTLWSKPACPQCTGAKLGFTAAGVQPDIRQLLEEPGALTAFKTAGFTSAPIIQFPEVRDGDEVLFEAKTVAGNQVDDIAAYGAAVKTLASRRELIAA